MSWCIMHFSTAHIILIVLSHILMFYCSAAITSQISQNSISAEKTLYIQRSSLSKVFEFRAKARSLQRRPWKFKKEQSVCICEGLKDRYWSLGLSPAVQFLTAHTHSLRTYSSSRPLQSLSVFLYLSFYGWMGNNWGLSQCHHLRWKPAIFSPHCDFSLYITHTSSRKINLWK